MLAKIAKILNNLKSNLSAKEAANLSNIARTEEEAKLKVIFKTIKREAKRGKFEVSLSADLVDDEIKAALKELGYFIHWHRGQRVVSWFEKVNMENKPNKKKINYYEHIEGHELK